MIDEPDLFGPSEPSLPQGFRYFPDVVPTSLQEDSLAHVRRLSFEAIDFHGFEGKRRVVSFGWRYDFAQERLAPTDSMPEFLLPLRDLAARFAGVLPERLKQALVTEYGPGSPIGWHKDKSVFRVVVGVSLLSACTFRLRRKSGAKWQRVSIDVEPGSVYVLSGTSRTEWEHSIPPVEHTRFSITFRELSGDV